MGNCGDILPMLSSIRGLGGKESNVVTCPLGARLPFVQQEETVLPPRAICDTDVFFSNVFAPIASEHRHSARRKEAPLAKGCAEPLVGWIRQELGSHSWVFISYIDETVKKALHQRPNKSEGWSDFTHTKHTSSQSPKMSNWDQRTDLFCAPSCYCKPYRP